MVKFLMSVLNWPINLWSNFTSFFIVMIHKSPVNFKLIHFLLWIKGHNKSPTFQTFKGTLVKICKIAHVIFRSTSQFSFKFSINLECHQTNINANYWDFWVMESKMVKFLISVLNWPVIFCSNFASFFIFMTHKSPVNFELIHFLLWIKGSNKSPNFLTFKCVLVKICQIPYVIFESTSHFSFKLWINIQCRQK